MEKSICIQRVLGTIQACNANIDSELVMLRFCLMFEPKAQQSITTLCSVSEYQIAVQPKSLAKQSISFNGPPRDETCHQGFQQGRIQTSFLCYRD